MISKTSIKFIISISFLFLLPIIHSVDEKNVAKVICSLNGFKEVDILSGIFEDSVKLSKSLQKECNMKFRFVTFSAIDVGRRDIVSFASHEMNKEKKTI